ncbi:MAG: hypothetical protein ACRCXD_09865 [Luteolibacter sp.]
MSPIRLTLVEGGEGGRLKLRGEFANGNTKTANGRLYKTSLWERVLQRNERKIADRKVPGELDHPEDGKMKLQRVSHLITNLKLEDGVVIGELEVLGTQRGKDLRALIEGGVTVGVSSRGLGTVLEDKDGTMVVSDDYEFQTFDVVADPAIGTAFPEAVTESRVDPKRAGKVTEDSTRLQGSDPESEDKEPDGSDGKMTAEKTPVPGAQSAGSEKETPLAKSQNMKKYMKKAEEMNAMKEANEKLNFVCKDLGFRLFCERQIQGHPNVAGIMEGFNANEHADLEAVKTWIKPFVEQRDTLVESKKVNREVQVASIENKLSALAEENAKLKAENSGLTAQLTESKAQIVVAEESLANAVKQRTRFMEKYETSEKRGQALVEENERLKLTEKKQLEESVQTDAKSYLESRFGSKTEALQLAKTLLENWTDKSKTGLEKLATIVESRLVKDKPSNNVRGNLHRMPEGTVEKILNAPIHAHPRRLTEGQESKNLGVPGLEMDVSEFKRMAGIKE